MIAGTVIGLWVGVLPGLGGPVAMAILIPFTFSMDPLSALLMLASISVGAAFGGSVTSILLNIPGEASSAATAYDGYPMEPIATPIRPLLSNIRTRAYSRSL